MAGQGFRKVRACLKEYGPAFRTRPRTIGGILACRHCGYQIAIHEQLETELADRCPHGASPGKCPVIQCANHV